MRALLFLAMWLAWVGAFAQTYPSKPVRIIVPYAPGGVTDSLSRGVAERLSKVFSQQFFVENKPGAALIIGTEQAARSAPDGYTLVHAEDHSISANPFLFSKLPYDPQKDFTPVAMMAFANEILVTPGEFAPRDLREFIEYAKANPGKLNYGSFGVGSPPHLAGELLKRMAGIQMTHVPYKGGNPAQAALLGGEIQAVFMSIGQRVPMIRQGRLKALAIVGPRRSALLPEVPTMDEIGYPGFTAGQVWFGLMAPAGTPQAIASLLNTEINKLLMNDAEFRERYIVSQGLEPAPMTLAQFAAHLRTNREDIARLVALSGARLD